LKLGVLEINVGQFCISVFKTTVIFLQFGIMMVLLFYILMLYY